MNKSFAVVGKGGVGKTTIAATLAKIMSESNEVLAIDADSDPNLAYSLGLGENQTSKITPIVEMKELIKERTGAEPGEAIGAVFKLNPHVTDIIDNYTLKIGNIKLLVLGGIQKTGQGCLCPATIFLKTIIRHALAKRSEKIALDLEAGTEHFGRKISNNFDVLFIVVEPSLKSVNLAKRISELAKDAGIKNIFCIGNKIRNEKEKDMISKACAEIDVELIEIIPYDEKIIECDLNGVSIIDKYPNLELVTNIKKIIERVS